MIKKNKNGVSLIIITYNVERTLLKLLKSIHEQDYPKSKMEIIMVDGQSTDKTLEIVKKSKSKVKVIQSPYPKDPEACRVIGIRESKFNIFCFIDADNYLHHKKWISNIMSALKENPDAYGAYAYRYLYDRNENAINRYFALLGAADPVGFYLKKDDRLSYLYDKWNLAGKILKETKRYLFIEYDYENFPTLGANASFFRKDLLLSHIKITPGNFFHIDTAYDMAKKGFNKYVLYKDGIGHSATDSSISFLKRRMRYMGIHYLSRSSSRRYKVFNPARKQDVINLVKFIFFSLTFVEPTVFAIRGYLKKPDFAWFIHPFFCFAICVTYIYSVLRGLLYLKVLNKKL